MRAHVLQHVSFEGLGSIQAWLEARKAIVTHTRFFQSATLPGTDQVDLLIALGGPMSVNDEGQLPWLVDEKRLVGEMVRSGKPVLGICLGAQLMASSLGARVYPGPHKEMGWFPVFGRKNRGETFVFPERKTVFHWHGETFDLPPGALLLASSEGCRHQAFQVGTRALGLQFHLETTPASADAIISNCAGELLPSRFTQPEPELRAVKASQYAGINQLMTRVLEYITRGSR